MVGSEVTFANECYIETRHIGITYYPVTQLRLKVLASETNLFQLFGGEAPCS